MIRFCMVIMLILGTLFSLQGQNRYSFSLGLELEESSDNVVNRSNRLKKHLRFEAEFPLYKKFNSSLGLRFSWKDKVFGQNPFEKPEFDSFSPIIIMPVRPQPIVIPSFPPFGEQIIIFSTYSYFTHTVAIPLGLSYDFTTSSRYPYSVYTNMEMAYNWGHHDDRDFETAIGPDTSLSFEGGFKIPVLRMENSALFFSPYIRAQKRYIQEVSAEIQNSIFFRATEDKIMGTLGLRLGLSIY